MAYAKKFMKIRFLTAQRPWVGKLVAAACVAGLLPFTTPAQPPAATRILPSHAVPAAVARLQPVESLAGTQHLNLAIGLPLRNGDELASLLQQIYDPASTNYHRYLTPGQFTKRFGPTEQDYQAVIAFAKANGLAVTGTHPNRMLVNVNGSVTDIEKTFQVGMHVYQHPKEARTFFAPDVEPSVPAGLPILDISGFNNYGRPYPKYKLKPANLATNATPNAGSGPGGSYMGNDFRKAYVPNVKLTGAGQTIALVQFDGYWASDIAAYEAMAGLPSVTLANVLIDGFSGVPTGSGGEVEVSLDIEMVISMAPDLSQVILYEGDPFNFHPNDVLNRIATDNSARQISCSWGWIGGPNATTSQIFRQMAAQGQSFFNASGDSDAFLPGQVDDPTQFGEPSNSSDITQVGGTTLTTSGPEGSWVSETVWNWGNEFGPAFDGVGSSGGISSSNQIPVWQQGINMSANGGSTTFRNIPDVAMTADNVFVIADHGIQYRGVGGTSCASPLWAGFAALVNQQAATVGQPPVGFINPAIYAIGKGANFTSDFHDTRTGNNTWSASPTNFFAVTGYDLCTGWGSPNGQNLIDILAPPCTPDGILEVTITPANGSTLLESNAQTIYVQVTDGVPVTNATVVATIIGSTNLVFKNNGVAPDATANDDIYTANLNVPANTNNLTLSFLITAPGKTNSTNVVSYSVVPTPGNNNFTNSIKVPAAGAVYLSNNKKATLESGEPQHDSDPIVGASLWWNWTPSVNTNVLLDAYGSAMDVVLAVYTGSALITLQPVAATNSAGTGMSAHLNFNAVANTTYQIAVASANSNSVGSLHFSVVPGGNPDTNAPTVTITSPLNGYAATNALITVSGTAIDQQPNASGVSQVFISLNGQCLIVAAGTTNWSDTFGLTPGLNNISVLAEDFAGNISAPVGIQVVYIVLAPPNDFFANATPLTNQSPATANNTGATKELGEPNHAGNIGGKSVWWLFQPPSDGVLTLNTTNSTFDTLLGLYTGPDVSHLTTIANNDDAYNGAPGGFSLINQAVSSNLVYYIAVDGYDGAFGNIVLSYSFVPASLCQLTVANNAGGTVQVATVNSLGGTVVMPGTSNYFASGSTVVLTAFPNSYYAFNTWSGSVNSSANPLSFVITGDMSITGSFGPMEFSDGFETGDLSKLPWMTVFDGNVPWFVQTNVVAAGQYAARSGVITDSESSSLFLTGTFGAGIGSFDYLVSSEQYWDIFSFYVDGVLQQQWSGEVGWANFAFPLTAGAHTLEWSYVKDPSSSSGLDAAFIDNVNLPIAGGGPPQFGSFVSINGTFQLTISSPALSTIIQASTNLASANWVNVFTGTPPFTYIDTQATNYPDRFYRAVGP
jgi:hypothetical protein